MVNPKRALSGLIRAAAFAGGLVAAAAAVAKPAYKIEAIPAAGDYVPHAAHAINSKGWVVGEVEIRRGVWACFVYAEGVTTVLPDSDQAICQGMNDLGDVVGAVGDQAYLWPHGGGPRQAVPGMRHAVDINNSGQIVGAAFFDGPAQHAAFYADGVLTDLGTLGGSVSVALRINESGWAVGWAEIDTGAKRGFRWKPGGPMKKLLHIAAWDSDADDLNDHGTVLGSTYDEDIRLVAYLDRRGPGGVEILPSIDGDHMAAQALNNHDEVLSNLWKSDGEGSSPALTRKGRTYRLSGLLDDSRAGWSLGSGLDINDAGQIVGTGRYNGEPRAFVATRVAED